jgi:hypothetical protein
MSGKRKRRFSTWADAEIAEDAARKQIAPLEIALKELVLGKVLWVEGEFNCRKVGLCKLDGAHGGVVVIVERSMVGARYLDGWASQMQALHPPLSSKEYTREYKAWLDLRGLATKAKAEQKAVNDRLREAAFVRPIGTVVDQSIRSY